jgi:hypothetical protein
MYMYRTCNNLVIRNLLLVLTSCNVRGLKILILISLQSRLVHGPYVELIVVNGSLGLI